MTAVNFNLEQSLESHWWKWVNRAIFLRSTIIAVVLGSLLTIINQPSWAAGHNPLQLLPFMLVFVTPFAVVMIAQIAGVRQAHIESKDPGVPMPPERFLSTIASHGIPARAVAISLVFGSLNAIFSLTDQLLRSGDIASMDIAPLGQAYVLPLVFGLASQAVSYRRTRYQITKS